MCILNLETPAKLTLLVDPEADMLEMFESVTVFTLFGMGTGKWSKTLRQLMKMLLFCILLAFLFICKLYYSTA